MGMMDAEFGIWSTRVTERVMWFERPSWERQFWGLFYF